LAAMPIKPALLSQCELAASFLGAALRRHRLSICRRRRATSN
jgi:hypothetical protein